MALFANRDLKLLKRELTSMHMALSMGAGASSSAARFAAGVASAEVDAVRFAKGARDAGKGEDVATLVATMRAKHLAGDAKAQFDLVLDQVSAVVA